VDDKAIEGNENFNVNITTSRCDLGNVVTTDGQAIVVITDNDTGQPPTATPTATRVGGATATPTATATRVGGATATPTATPVGGVTPVPEAGNAIFLPLISRKPSAAALDIQAQEVDATSTPVPGEQLAKSQQVYLPLINR
jgi:hypothetical protein